MIRRIRSFTLLFTLYAIGAAAGYLFESIGLPLPWMIGPMVLTGILTLTGLSNVVVPVGTRPYGQATVASQVALFFTPAAFHSLILNVPLLVGMALLICCIAVFVALILSRLATIPLANALIAVLPTSPVEASVTAERHGFDPAPIILAQIIRISTVVIAIPMTLYFLEGVPDRAQGASQGAFDLVSIAILALVAWVGVVLFRFLRIANPYFMGPLALVAVLNVVGVPLEPFPPVILMIAQILLGTWLGSTFRRSLFTSAGRYVTSAVACSILFVATCSVTGVAMSHVLGLPLDLMLLAMAPGGVTEMALTAKVMGVDIAMITAFHLTRLFIIVPNISWFVDAVDRRARSRS